MITSSKRHWVAKFGGTSVATYPAMVRCATIIANYPNVRVIVVSAPAGITNLLINLSQTHLNRAKIEPIFNEIKLKVNTILTEFSQALFPELHQEIEYMFQRIEHLAIALNNRYCRRLTDELLAYGEQFSARLFHALLTSQGHDAIYQDARTLIKTNDHFGKAAVFIQETKTHATDVILRKYANQIVVTEGFVGSTAERITTTLGRGGSDYSAAILAEAINAEVLQIWTDVCGIYTADPRLVSHAKPIENICFNEAAELATFGAKVLHPATLWPAIRKNIPVFVGSSMDAEAQGTWIRSTYPDHVEVPFLQAITLRRHQSLLTITSLEMLHTHGFLAKIFSVLANHALSVDLVTTSEVSVALTLNYSGSEDRELLTPEILSELQAIGNVSLKVDKNLCLIALVGNYLNITSGISGQLFNLLRSFNIRLINHGASPHNLCFLVNEVDATAIIQTIHREFFEKNI